MDKYNFLWQTKLAARLHDPAEKALVLLRDPEGHEKGTSKALTRLLFIGAQALPETIDPDNDEVLSRVIFKRGLKSAIYRHVQRADWWAAAADRPQWPMEEITRGSKTFKVAEGAQVRWTNKPVLIHPLTGAQFDLGKHGRLSDTDFHDIKQRSFDHFSGLLKTLGIQNAENATEDHLRKTLLAFWRFGPELGITGADTEDFGKLGALWGLLPADTRIPDHSIWDHLDLTSAFAGAFAADPNGEAALLALSIGPVQGFIAAARKMDDLWAGSHLLSRLAWEAMLPVCEQLGPDAILFPRLRGIPQVDLWLRDQMKLPDALFENCEWMQGGTDANPLFSAALPNRFVAVVPASRARELAETVQAVVREWLRKLGADVVSRLLHEAGLDAETTTPYAQMKEQLKGFPEVHWAAVPFSLIHPRNAAKQTDLDVSALSSAMAPFFGAHPGKDCGFLDSDAWKALQEGIDWGDGTTFFAPNPGVLYPAVYDLAERVLAAAKAARTFEQSKQTGWRCSMTGEAEWLTTDRTQLEKSYRQQTDTLWARITKARPAWAKKGEHLSALPAIKRLWPTIFTKEVEDALGQNGLGRFVVSTHTMALAHQLDQWLEHGGLTAEGLSLTRARYRSEPVALPRRLIRQHWANPKAIEDAKHLPGLLELTNEEDFPENEAAEIRHQVRATLANAFTPGPSPGGRGEKTIRLETYYALLMMDGDRMGAILSGDDKTGCAIPYRESFHPQVRAGFDQHAARQPMIKRYGDQNRPVSPNRHLAISGALNDFSQTLVRHVVEEEHLGRVIYAGGDDVLAMLPVADLLPTMQRLRQAYAGHDPDHEGGVWQGLTLQNGFAALKTDKGLRLMRMMGERATASCGAVIAHHQAPLAAVLRELRAAEKRAKNYRRLGENGKPTDRDAFSISVIKRSGGALYLTERWGESVQLLADLRDFLATEGVSRRAVYNTQEWLHDLPEPGGDGAMLASLLAFQITRQTKIRNKKDLEALIGKLGRGISFEKEDDDKKKLEKIIANLAQRLTALALQQMDEHKRLKRLQNFLTVAEFLARETRAGAD